MFVSLAHHRYSVAEKCNSLCLRDTCFEAMLYTPKGSPKLPLNLNSYGNTLILYSLIYFYNNHKLNVSRNLAYYYRFLINEGFYLNKLFIKQQFRTLNENSLIPNIYDKYCHSTLRYMGDELRLDGF